MVKFILSILTFCVLGSSTIVAELPRSQAASKEEMINHLIGIQNLFQSMYAPAEWKKEYIGWELKDAVQQAIEKINAYANITQKDYHEILVALFNSPKDYHLSIQFISTESAILPFRVRGAENRYFVAWIDESVIADFPLQIGDEIIAFDGQPVAEAIDDLILHDRRELINETDLELASVFLTMRAGAIGHRVPQGEVEILSKSPRSSTIREHKMKWNYQKELIKGLPGATITHNEKEEGKRPRTVLEGIKYFNFHNNMTTPLASAVKQIQKKNNYDAFPVGNWRGPLPYLGTPLWTPRDGNYFFSYIFENDDNKKIGYIRIPHFMPGFSACSDDVENKDIWDLRFLMISYQRKTDALVIDLVDNGGGALESLIAYLSVLSSKPLPFFKQRVSITQEEVLFSLTSIRLIDHWLTEVVEPEETNALQNLRGYFSFICDEWNAGRSLSDPVHIYSIDQVHPDPAITYNKPILILVNGLDFSCADLFPAVLQDAGRATIFGSKTAGAGGAVQVHTYPNQLGIAGYSYTSTILERNNQQPLENLGVTPDIPYQVTPEDLQNNYAGYVKAVHEALKQLLR